MRALQLFILFLPLLVFSQVDGAIFTAGHQGKWLLTQRPLLQEIHDQQDKLIITNTAIALAQADWLGTKKESYHSKSTLDEDILASSIILQAIQIGEDLVTIQIETFNATSNYPEIQAIIIPSHADLIIESTVLLVDIYTGIRNGIENQMNSSERLLFLRDILHRLEKLKAIGTRIYFQSQDLIDLSQLNSLDFETPVLDITALMNQTRAEIQTIVN